MFGCFARVRVCVDCVCLPIILVTGVALCHSVSLYRPINSFTKAKHAVSAFPPDVTGSGSGDTDPRSPLDQFSDLMGFTRT